MGPGARSRRRSGGRAASWVRAVAPWGELYARLVADPLAERRGRGVRWPWDRPRRVGGGLVVTWLRLRLARRPRGRAHPDDIGGTVPITELADSVASSRPDAQAAATAPARRPPEAARER